MSKQPTEQEVLQKNLMQFLVKDVFNTITKDDVLKVVSPNVWMYRGMKLTPDQVVNLRDQAKNLKSSKIWEVLKNELLYHAHLKGYVQSKTEADQIAGKMMVYITDVIDSRLNKMIEF